MGPEPISRRMRHGRISKYICAAASGGMEVKMLKGCQRSLIMMQTPDSALFETAYFVLKRKAEVRAPHRNEMVCEARRILEENSLARKKFVPKKRHIFIAFASGLGTGGLTVGITWLINAVS